MIDNFGDAGVTYRLVRNLIIELSGVRIRLFTNGLKAFSELNGDIDSCSKSQSIGGAEYYSYEVIDEEFLRKYPPAELVIEAFACNIPQLYYQTALNSECLIINIDHLSAEKWIEGIHLKESLTGAKAKKFFFMPGFTLNSGGLILDRIHSVSEKKQFRKDLCRFFKLDGDALIGTVFTYEHDFSGLISDIFTYGKKTELIIFGEKSRSSFEPLLMNFGFDRMGNRFSKKNMTVIFAGFILQENYDLLLKAADFNFVRGEDSWARACLSGRPFIWHSYFQKDNYQLVKVKAFNDLLKSYYADTELFGKLSEYQTVFNDRSDGVKDLPFSFFLENLEPISSSNEDMSEFLFKNCNLINNLLFFADSL